MAPTILNQSAASCTALAWAPLAAATGVGLKTNTHAAPATTKIKPAKNIGLTRKLRSHDHRGERVDDRRTPKTNGMT
ncbi:MAG: hypothetical protein QM811_29445 [Pirellulales bacterium]